MSDLDLWVQAFRKALVDTADEALKWGFRGIWIGVGATVGVAALIKVIGLLP